MSSRSPVYTIFTIVMDLLVIVAIAVTCRLVVSFFGVLAAGTVGKVILAFTDPVTIPLGMDAIKTPYGGIFDVDAGLTIVILLLAEWVLSLVRSRS
ncbi:MAG TPA: hypothetical protein VFG89_10510 [Coriobacteriia bacterium]|nr:hypothetical protein [Coriobacteriia bacterium]